MGDDKTRIIYAPGVCNSYSYAHDTVFLDEQLKDYPKAHDLIKRHELTHAEQKANGDGLAEFLKLEFETDMEIHFSDSDAMREVHEYYENRTERGAMPLAFHFGNFLRGLWKIPLVAVGEPVKAVKRYFK